MAFPGPKVHRVSRRKLGRGQSTTKAAANVDITAAGSTATLEFDVPVVINGTIPMTVATRTFVSQTILDNQHVEILFSGALATLDYDLPGQLTQIQTFQGGSNNADSGTFP